MASNRTAFVGVMLTLALILASFCAHAQEIEPIKWSMKTETPSAPPKPCSKFTLKMTAKIDEGWHLYSLEQVPGGPMATRIAVPDNQPFKLTGEIGSPMPRIELDPNFNVETQYYEDEAIFSLPITVSSSAPAGKQQLKVNVSFQTCNRSTCLPPKTLLLVTEVIVGAPKRD